MAIAKHTGVIKARQNQGKTSDDGTFISGKRRISSPKKPKETPIIPKIETLSSLKTIPKIYVKVGDKPITKDVKPTGIFDETRVSTDMGIEKAKIPTKKYIFKYSNRIWKGFPIRKVISNRKKPEIPVCQKACPKYEAFAKVAIEFRGNIKP